jgi:glucosamine 6-phosphate synthetase-like amidotransferase/phosphosugar isomerase protein
MEVCSLLQGAYALLIKSARYPNELVACKQGSPLVYGLKRCAPPSANGAAADAAAVAAGSAGVEVWLSSDSAALLKHTREIVVGRGAGVDGGRLWGPLAKGGGSESFWRTRPGVFSMVPP